MNGRIRAILTHARPTLAAALCLAAIVVFARKLEPHYALEDWLFWPVARLWGYVLLYTAACVGLGHLALRRLWRLQMPLAETWLLSKGVGLVAFVLTLYAAGALSALHPAVAIGLPVTMVAVSARDLLALGRRTITELRDHPPARGGTWLIRRMATAGGIVGFAILYAIGFTPEAISLDAAWYHLPIAQDYARAGAIIPFPSEYNRAFPHLASMVYTWGFLLPGIERPFNWMLALHLEFSILVWKAVAVVVGAQWMLGNYRVRGLWTGFFLFPLIFAFAHSVTGGSEHFVGLWAVPMFIATCRMLRHDFSLRWATLLGVFSGGAILSKYQAIYMIAACGSLIFARWVFWVAVLAYRRGLPFPARRLWLAPVSVIGVGLVVASPHFVKNMLFYGDPMYPFLQAKLSTAHPTHELADYLFHSKLGSENNRPTAEGLDRLKEAVSLFWNFSFEPHYVVVKKKWPLFGSLFTLLLPALLLLRRSARIWLAVWCCFVGIAIWSNTYLQDRYLNATAPLFTAATMAILVRLWDWSRVTRVAIVPLVAFQIAWNMDAFVFTGQDLVNHALKLGRSGWEDRLEPERRYPYRRGFDFVNEATPPDAQILVRGTREVLGLDRFAQRDVQWQQASIVYGPIANAAELWQHYRDRGITHVVYRKTGNTAGTLQSVVLFLHLVHTGGMPLTSSRGWVLMELPPAAPAVEPTLQVMVLGHRPLYPDGLYLAEDLGLYGRKDRQNRGAVSPREAATTDEGLAELLDKADMVAVGRRSRATAPLSDALARDFKLLDTVKNVKIYARRADGQKPRGAR